MTHSAAFSELPNTASIVPPSWASQPTIEPPIGINAPRGRSPQGQDGSRTGEGYRTSWYVTCGRRSADGSGATTMQGMRTVLAVALAGAVGALARWGLGAWFGHRFPSFPWGTMVRNVSGSFILGVIFAVLVERNIGSATLRVALMTGLMGPYTTFSTFSLETFRLFEDGATGLAMANIGFSVVLGLLAVWLGVVSGRAVAWTSPGRACSSRSSTEATASRRSCRARRDGRRRPRHHRARARRYLPWVRARRLTRAAQHRVPERSRHDRRAQQGDLRLGEQQRFGRERQLGDE